MIKKLSIKSGARDAELGKIIELTNYSTEVVRCLKTGELMVHLDLERTDRNDFSFVRACNLTIAYPESEVDVSINAHFRDQADLATMLYVFFLQYDDIGEVDNLYNRPVLRT